MEKPTKKELDQLKIRLKFNMTFRILSLSEYILRIVLISFGFILFYQYITDNMEVYTTVLSNTELFFNGWIIVFITKIVYIMSEFNKIKKGRNNDSY